MYPPPIADRRAEWLPFYARTFRTVEVNSTFYATPSPRTVAGWIARARAVGSFEFSVKAPQTVTHGSMVSSDAERVASGVRAFARAVVSPIVDAGCFGALLFQLSPGVRNDEPGRAALAAALAAAPEGIDLAVEFRHATFVEEGRLARGALETLRERDAAPCVVDGPGFPTLEAASREHAYVRFHGRRADAWFSRDRRDEDRPARYDYLYAREALADLAPLVRRLESGTRRVRAYFNNHPDGKAWRNAREFSEILGLPPPPPPPGKAQAKLGDFSKH